MFYKDIVYKYFDNSCNVGTISNATHTSMIGNYQGGSVVKLTAIVKNNIIEEIKFKVYGGVALIACMSLLTDLIKKKSVEYAMSITSNQIIETLNLDSSKYVYAIMAIDSLKELISQTQ